MGFILFLLVTAALLIRPGEQMPELRDARIYESLILLCFAFSFGSVLEQFSIDRLETRPITLCMFGLLVAVVLSHFSQGNAAKAAETGFEFFKIVVYYLLLVGNVTTMLRLRIFAICLGLCAVAFVTLAVLQYHEVIVLPEPEPVVAVYGQTKGNVDTKDAFVKDIEYDPVSGQNVEFKRLRGTGIFHDPNDLSLLLTMGMFIALYCMTDKTQVVFSLAWAGILVLFIYALLLTHSRAGLLGMLAGFLTLFHGRFGWRGTLFLGLPLLPVAFVFFGGRMASISASEGTGQTRIQIWSDSIAAMMTAPLFGVGLNELPSEVGKAAHNSFVSAYAELGLFGGTLFFGVFFVAVAVPLRLLKARQYVLDPELRRFLPFLAAMLIAYGTGILSLSRTDAVPTYLLLGLATITGSLAVQRCPALTLRLNANLLRPMALANVAFLAGSYMVVRLLKG